MWKWDQGRMEYFQFDELRNVASFSVNYDLKRSAPDFIRSQTGLPFAAPETHSPWRNYSRIYKLCLIVAENESGNAIPTDVATILGNAGKVTCDEYMHFLAEATTDPSPALVGWRTLSTEQTLRSPLCFALKYVLAKLAALDEDVTTINEIIGAYRQSGFTGVENDVNFRSLMGNRGEYANAIVGSTIRQARESIKFLTQISYLHNANNEIVVTLDQKDASEIFQSLNPISGFARN